MSPDPQEEASVEVVLVGVDGSPGSREALTWAYRYAERTGASLQVVTAFRYEEVVGVPGASWPVQTFEEIQLEARRLQREVTEAVIPEDTAVSVQAEVVFGNPVSVLLERAATVDLLVLGSRGLGGFKGLILGSVSQQCLHHAPCAVTVVRAPHE